MFPSWLGRDGGVTWSSRLIASTSASRWRSIPCTCAARSCMHTSTHHADSKTTVRTALPRASSTRRSACTMPRTRWRSALCLARCAPRVHVVLADACNVSRRAGLLDAHDVFLVLTTSFAARDKAAVVPARHLYDTVAACDTYNPDPARPGRGTAQPARERPVRHGAARTCARRAAVQS
jgi:hypothetical protein